jgi:D-sedoheptulose 7-phosphate isomerase
MSSKKKDNFYLGYISKIHNVLNSIELNKIEKLEKLVDKSRKNKILIFGNGAGASISSHFANDLSNTAKIKTLSFDNSAHLTCFANDYGYENWVKKTIEIFSEKNDLIILLSASGKSKNMINAAKHCKINNINFFSITGFVKDNLLNKVSKNFIWIDSKSYNQVELSQLFVLLSVIDKINLKR